MDEAGARRGAVLTLYLDTSVLVSALTSEPDTRAMQAWLTAQVPEECAISDWVVAEFSSALSIKLRAGGIDLLARSAALAMFTRLAAESFGRLAISSAQFRTAARFADRHDLGMRAGDALHLAICADHGSVLCTLDRRLAAAGPPLGVQTRLL